jgi:Uncharacterized protein conserved in bacteria (DUF2330)
MGNRRWLWAVPTLSLAVVAYGERDAAACGGCIPPPPPPHQSVDTVITGERMIFSISKDQTTLYDEITYSGKPSSFAWVLPIKGEVEVGLSADILFATIDQLTASTVLAPPTDCPAPPTNCAFATGGGSGGGCSFGSSSSDSAEAPGYPNYTGSGGGGGSGGSGGSGVSVLTQSQVGPYEMVQLKSSDGSALTQWLDANGYKVPASDAPVIAHYVSEGMDFLALKLIPGEGVQAMQPVRVTTKGAFPVLPLRMVGVGTGATTSITLWVVADGRWEPQNFPFFTIQSSELSWDWTSESSNYESLRLSKEAGLAGRGWQLESSLELNQNAVDQSLLTAIQQNFGGAGGYVDPSGSKPKGGSKDAGVPDAVVPSDAESDADDASVDAESSDAQGDAASDASGDAGADASSDGGVSSDASAPDAPAGDASAPDAPAGDAGKPGDDDAAPPSPTEDQLADQDLAVLFQGIAGPNARITRMRSDIAHSALSADLVIQASSDTAEISNQYNPEKQVGQPLCTLYDSSCSPEGQVPRDQARAAIAAINASSPTSNTSGGGCACTTTSSGPIGWRTTCGLLLGAAWLGVVRPRQRRRRKLGR